MDPLMNIENAVEGKSPGHHIPSRRGIGGLPEFLRVDMSKSQRKRFWKRSNASKKTIESDDEPVSVVDEMLDLEAG